MKEEGDAVMIVEIGTVEFFDGRTGDGLISVDGCGEIPFHFNDGVNVKMNEGELQFCGDDIDRKPQKGDVVVFERNNFGYGDLAIPWCFESDYRKAEREEDKTLCDVVPILREPN